MKIFLSYKQTWLKINKLKLELDFIKDVVSQCWHEIYIHLFEKNKNSSSKYILNKVKLEIEKSDLILWFVNNSEKSEWELLELWIAEWMNKKILLLVNEKYREKFFLIYWLNTSILYYREVKEINNLLTNFLSWK
jgi:hypothetical protein